MPIFQVSYDLNKPGQNYPKIEKAIEASHQSLHILKSTWLVWTNETVNQLQARLLKAIDRNDYLFISRVTAEKNGWMKPLVWKWINDRLLVESQRAG